MQTHTNMKVVQQLLQCCFVEIWYQMIGGICCERKKQLQLLCLRVCVCERACSCNLVCLFECASATPPSLLPLCRSRPQPLVRRPLRLPCFDRCSLCPNASQRTLWRLSHSPSLPLSLFPPFYSSHSQFQVFLGPCMTSTKVYTFGTLLNTIHNVTFLVPCPQTSRYDIPSCYMSVKHMSTSPCGCIEPQPAPQGLDAIEPCSWSAFHCFFPLSTSGAGVLKTKGEGGYDARKRKSAAALPQG